jgi:hypothetical protein
MSLCEQLQDNVRRTVVEFLENSSSGGTAKYDVTRGHTFDELAQDLHQCRHELFERFMPLVSALDLKPFMSELPELGAALIEFEETWHQEREAMSKLAEPFALPENLGGLLGKIMAKTHI